MAHAPCYDGSRLHLLFWRTPFMNQQLPTLKESRLGTLVLSLQSSNGITSLRVAVGLPLLVPMRANATYLFQIEGEEEKFHFPEIGNVQEHRVQNQCSDLIQAGSVGKTEYPYIPEDLQELVNRISRLINREVSDWYFENIHLVVRAVTWDFSIHPETLLATIQGRRSDSPFLQ
jgi:hypothetical protein